MKNWYKSKTVWLGVAAVLIAVADAMQEGLNWHAAVIAAIGALGVFIRTQTFTQLGSPRVK